MSVRKEVESALREAVKCRLAVVFSHRDLASLNQMRQVLTKYGERVEEIEVKEGDVAALLNVVERKALPLLFVKGDCFGELQEVIELDNKGLIRDSLVEHRYDIIVLGGGSGGLSAALEAGKVGKRVLCVDYVQPSVTLGTWWGLGGSCVNVGCVPKKLLHHAAILRDLVNDAELFGWKREKGDMKHDWRSMKNAVQKHITSIRDAFLERINNTSSIEYINGFGKFVGSHEMSVTDRDGNVRMFTADKFVIATGLRPALPKITGLKECCITSDDLFSLDYNPGKTLCVGSSYVALECAGFLRSFGNDVTVSYPSAFLNGYDEDMAERIRAHMIELGINFEKENVLKCERVEERRADFPGVVCVHREGAKNGCEMQIYTEIFNTVLVATERYATTDNLGLDTVGVKCSHTGKVITRREQTVNCPYIYAVGDVVEGSPEVMPVAALAGKLLIQRLFTGSSSFADYENVPAAIFTPLEYGFCGLSEDTAVERYGTDAVNVYHAVFMPLEYAVPSRMDSKHCYCKLICLKAEQDRVVGLHILAPNAGEITQGFALGLKLGAKKEDFDRLVGIHPTVAQNFTLTVLREGLKELELTAC